MGNAAAGGAQDAPAARTASTEWPALPGETAWERIARLRRLREQLDQAIANDTPDAVRAAKAAGVKVPELAELWRVTQAWIYTVAPARAKKIN